MNLSEFTVEAVSSSRGLSSVEGKENLYSESIRKRSKYDYQRAEQNIPESGNKTDVKKGDGFLTQIEEHYRELISLQNEGKTDKALQLLAIFKEHNKLDYKNIKKIYINTTAQDFEVLLFSFFCVI